VTISKINLLLLPLLFAILLSISSKLRIGSSINTFFYNIFSPIHYPLSKLRLFTEQEIYQVKNLPSLNKQVSDLKNQNAHLISENDLLKQLISDQKTLTNLNTPFKEVIPVHLIGSTGNYTVSSSFPLEKVRPGQALISDNILLGTVSEIKGSLIIITPLDSNKTPVFPVHTSSGQKGLYKYLNHLSQISDVPSQNPINLGDFILTEPSDLFPGDLLVGKTIRLLSTSQEPLQKAEVSLYTSFAANPQNLAIIIEQ
jgi:cell shape-determining protein MreC